jgi:hypothetical protein
MGSAARPDAGALVGGGLVATVMEVALILVWFSYLVLLSG